MTTEEKAKAYDEALKIATDAHKDTDKHLKATLERIFPELCESEDERIRQKLVWLLQQDICPFPEEEVAQMVAYLEKQKNKKYEMIQWTGDNLNEVIKFTGKSPMFEKWFKSWEEYEEYVHSHGNIFKLFNDDGSHYEAPVSAWIVKTPDGNKIFSEVIKLFT